MPGAYTQRDWENTLVLERQGENICVPELLKKIKLMGRGDGVGEVGAAGGGAVEGRACLKQMENVPITGDVSQL